MEACLKINSSGSKLDGDEKIIKMLPLLLTFTHSFLLIYRHFLGLHMRTGKSMKFEALHADRSRCLVKHAAAWEFYGWLMWSDWEAWGSWIRRTNYGSQSSGRDGRTTNFVGACLPPASWLVGGDKFSIVTTQHKCPWCDDITWKWCHHARDVMRQHSVFGGKTL